MIFALAWAGCLLIAYVIYPQPDNLLVSYVVYLAFGVDGVEQLTGVSALAIAILEVAFVFCVGYAIGRLVWQEGTGNDHG